MIEYSNNEPLLLNCVHYFFVEYIFDPAKLELTKWPLTAIQKIYFDMQKYFGI